MFSKQDQDIVINNCQWCVAKTCSWCGICPKWVPNDRDPHLQLPWCWNRDYLRATAFVSSVLNALTLSGQSGFENYLGHLRRPNPARGDRVHSDPVFREVQRHVLCQNVDRALGRSIGPPRKVCTCSFSAQLACLVESGEQICCSDSPRCSSLSKSGLASAPLRLAPWSLSQPHSPGETLKHFRKHCLTMKPTDSVKIDLDEGKNIFTIACKAPSLSYPNPPL